MLATLTTQLYDAVLTCERNQQKIQRTHTERVRDARFTQTLISMRSVLNTKSVRSRADDRVSES
jgi:hypothetical protein